MRGCLLHWGEGVGKRPDSPPAAVAPARGLDWQPGPGCAREATWRAAPGGAGAQARRAEGRRGRRGCLRGARRAGLHGRAAAGRAGFRFRRPSVRWPRGRPPNSICDRIAKPFHRQGPERRLPQSVAAARGGRAARAAKRSRAQHWVDRGRRAAPAGRTSVCAQGPKGTRRKQSTVCTCCDWTGYSQGCLPISSTGRAGGAPGRGPGASAERAPVQSSARPARSIRRSTQERARRGRRPAGLAAGRAGPQMQALRRCRLRRGAAARPPGRPYSAAAGAAAQPAARRFHSKPAGVRMRVRRGRVRQKAAAPPGRAARGAAPLFVAD